MSNWWLITWTTYGTWLPGDPRGFQTWQGRRYIPPPARYAKPGEPTYRAQDYEDEFREAQESMTEDPVHLEPDQQRLAAEAIVEEAAFIPISPAVLAVGRDHAHFLAKFGMLLIRPTIGRLKAAAVRRLHDAGAASHRIWCRNCHMKSKAGGEEFRMAFHYVRRHETEGAFVYVWPHMIDDLH